MFSTLSFFTTRTGILLTSSLILAIVFSWGMIQKVAKVELEKKIAENEASYQARVATALERQRDAINQAVLEERKRLKENESKWKQLNASIKHDKDFKSTAPVSVVHALNRLSKSPGDGPEVLSTDSGLPPDR